jgi:hypothetical protein
MGLCWREPLHLQHVVFLRESEQAMPLQVDCSVRVCRENMHAVFHFFLVFTLCVENEPLEYVIIPRDDATHVQERIVIYQASWHLPYFQSRIVAIVLASTSARYLR